MSVDYPQPSNRRKRGDDQRSPRLIRNSRPQLRRVDRKMDERIRTNRPSRKNRDPIVSTLIVERLPEGAVETRQLLEPRDLIDFTRSCRALVDFLQQHDVGLRFANDL